MIEIIGAGKMGASIVTGLLRRYQPAELTVVQHGEAKRAALVERFPGVVVSDSLVACDGAVVAVRPDQIPAVVSDAVGAGAKRIVSVAAGVTTAMLHSSAGHNIPVIRAMPNQGAQLGESATSMCLGPGAKDDDVAWATEVLSALGSVVVVPEAQMNAATGLAGSGPGYLFLIAEALVDAGVHAGLNAADARELTAATFAGVSALLANGEAPIDRRLSVMSPGGTTAAGVRVLENRGVRAALIDAVLAAAERSAANSK